MQGLDQSFVPCCFRHLCQNNQKKFILSLIFFFFGRAVESGATKMSHTAVVHRSAPQKPQYASAVSTLISALAGKKFG